MFCGRVKIDDTCDRWVSLDLFSFLLECLEREKGDVFCLRKVERSTGVVKARVVMVVVQSLLVALSSGYL